jgi:MOSC domain-containing protein YiiM
MPFEGRVLGINIAAAKGEPMQSLTEAVLLDGKGIEGDRYAEGNGMFSKNEGAGRHVTLVEAEAVEAVARELGVELTPEQTRRNIVTRDVPLNHLVGRQFAVGDIVLEGIRLCEPCAYLGQLTSDDIRRALLHRCGLRAEIVRAGTVRVGDRVTPC